MSLRELVGCSDDGNPLEGEADGIEPLVAQTHPNCDTPDQRNQTDESSEVVSVPSSACQQSYLNSMFPTGSPERFPQVPRAGRQSTAPHPSAPPLGTVQNWTGWRNRGAHTFRDSDGGSERTESAQSYDWSRLHQQIIPQH